MAKRDYYDILGINKNSDEAAIKKAYRGLAMECHPDRNPDDIHAAEKMKEINEAYAVLSDRNKRGLYDTYGHAGLEGFTQEDIFRGVDFTSIFEGLFGGGLGCGGSVFENLFGRQRNYRAKQTQRGADLRYDLSVNLEDIAFGMEKEINIPKVETCSVCNGNGAKQDGLKECEACRGSGQLVSERRSGSTLFRQVTTCGRCNGRGCLVIQPCDECGGKGYIESRRELCVSIPKGADTGYRIRIEGEGGAGINGNGDLYIILRVEEHPVFERHGDDIYMVKEVDLTHAALGGELDDIPGLEGNLSLNIPEGTQNGAVFRIIDKGIPHLNNHGSGDEYVVIKLVTPTDLTEDEKKLLRKFQKSRRHKVT